MSSFAAGATFTSPRVRVARPMAPTRPGRPEASVRLTRRGRLVITLLFLGVFMAGLTVFGATSAATDKAGEPLPTRTVVVDSGDTLWDIAATVAAPGKTREMVYRIQELNALPDSALHVGQRIAVPLD